MDKRSFAATIVRRHRDLRSAIAGAGVERDDPGSGAFGATFAVRAGDFVFTTAMRGVVAMDEGVSRFASVSSCPVG